MVQIKCPKCRADVEVEDFKKDDQDKTAVFCTNEKCTYHDNPLVGLDRKDQSVYISESLL